MIKLKKGDEIDIWSADGWLRVKYVKKHDDEVSVVLYKNMEHRVYTNTVRTLDKNNPNVTFKKEI